MICCYLYTLLYMLHQLWGGHKTHFQLKLTNSRILVTTAHVHSSIRVDLLFMLDTLENLK